MSGPERVEYNPEYVQKVYAETYASYLALPGFASERKYLRHRFLLVLKKAGLSTPGNGTYMDLGCGLGIKTRILADFFNESTGLDFVERCVQICNLLNDKPGLVYVQADATQASVQRYDFVSAFGLSVFNVAAWQDAADSIVAAVKGHCKPGGAFMVYSFTDFSGKSPSGWVNHSAQDLKRIVQAIQAAGFKASIVFPHRLLGNYLGNGLRHLLVEKVKFLSRKRRDYYIVIQSPQN